MLIGGVNTELHLADRTDAKLWPLAAEENPLCHGRTFSAIRRFIAWNMVVRPPSRTNLGLWPFCNLGLLV